MIGASLQPNLEFEAYIKPTQDSDAELLLHSNTHPTIDYTGKEGESTIDKYRKHYVAIFDPAAGQLEIIEAKKLTVRSTVRQQDPEPDSDESTRQPSGYSSRVALTAAFGTKKSKKAVQSIAANRLLAGDGVDTNNALSKALLSAMPVQEGESTAASLQSNKPLPQPNLTTENINEVYNPPNLVRPFPATETLESMPIAQWLDFTTKSRPIMTSSRFTSNRVDYLCKAYLVNPSNDVLKTLVQLLRYIHLLVELYRYLKSLKEFKKVPHPMQWPSKTISGNVPYEILEALTKHYTPGQAGPTPNRLTLLTTTIFALTLHIPPPSLNVGQVNRQITDSTDIALDLGIDAAETRRLFRELGCRLMRAQQSDLKTWGIRLMKRPATEGENGEQANPILFKIAVLKFPLEFPQARGMRKAAMRKGRR